MTDDWYAHRTTRVGANRTLKQQVFTMTSANAPHDLILHQRRAARLRVDAMALSVVIGVALVGAVSLVPVDGVQAKSKSPSYARMRKFVLAAPREKLRRIGAHIIVGYDVASQLTPFLKRGAIGGIFVTKRNSRRRSTAKLAAEISKFRELAAGRTQRPLWISTDQEGGVVSRLTPPLPRQRALKHVVLGAGTEIEREKAVRAFALKQARALSDVGVNINFAPVVDLGPVRALKRDRYTRLGERAISRDPGIVTFAAATYCEALAMHDVLCTLKHFPGLSRVRVDTHLVSAKLKVARDDMEGQDWVPFREVLEAAPAALMIGHPHIEAIDADNPASTSAKVIGGIVRSEWKFNGLVITDDLDMGAIRKRPGGIGKAALDALNAGADLVLFTFDPSRIVPVYYALLKAFDDGRLDKAKLDASARRLDAVAETIQTRGKRYVKFADHDKTSAGSRDKQ